MLVPRGLREHVLRVAEATNERRQEREGNLRMAFEDAAEMPALDTERRRRLHRGIRDRLERPLIEVLEHGDMLQEVDRRGHGGDARRYSRSMPQFRIVV